MQVSALLALILGLRSRRIAVRCYHLSRRPVSSQVTGPFFREP